MTFDFWDTSALAKLLLPERGSEWAAERSEQIVISRLTLVEIASALGRRCRDGEFDALRRDELHRAFLASLHDFEVIDLTDVILAAASQLLLAAPSALRSLDAIQLAGARQAFAQAEAAGIDRGFFIVADQRLLDAAIALGIATLNPEDYEADEV